MRVSVTPQRVELTEGFPIAVHITVTNDNTLIGGYHLRLLGADPAWVILDAENLSLFPDTSQTIRAMITIPKGIGAGDRRIAIQVRELTPPQAISVTEVDLVVPALEAMQMRLTPMTVLAGSHGQFGVVIENAGNTTVSMRPFGVDDEGKIKFRFTPAVLNLSPGEHAITDLRTSAPRRWFGSPAVRAFSLAMMPAGLADGRLSGATPALATPGGAAVSATVASAPPPQEIEPLAKGTFMQKPRLGRGVLSLIGLILAVTVFAVVITVALSRLVGASAADRDLALKVAAAQAENSGGGGSSSLAGAVVLLTSGAPVEGVAVELFAVGQVGTPLASTATAKDGTWKMPGLAQGKYQIRFRSAGFEEIWFPAALTAADAQQIELNAGQAKADINVVLGGLPATISGQVIGADVAGAILTVQVPADQLPTDDGAIPAGTAGVIPGAQVKTAPIGSDGLFTLTDLASPAVYDLVVNKPGYATDTQRVDLAGGEDRGDISLRLRTGDGVITGMVSGPDGALGEAVITATSGQNTVKTVSLTENNAGAFTLRGLVTPGTYTVTVSLAGYTTSSSSVSLNAGQVLDGVQLSLAKAAGSLAGAVTTLTDNAPAPGVKVTVSSGDTAISTVTQSAGSVGSWTVAGLPIPSTYTVTFSRADLQSQTVAVSLDANGTLTSGSQGAGVSETGITIGMQSAFAIITGTVTQQAAVGTGSAVGEASVTLVSATDTYTVTTASIPVEQVGRFEIANVVPGTYTLSVARKGTRPTSLIITVTAGQVLRTDPILIPPASLTGTVTDRVSGPAAGIEVVLYQAGQYPATVYQTTTTDSRGRYFFADIDAPQSYVVEIRTPALGALGSATVSLSASDAGVVDLAFGTVVTTPALPPPAIPTPLPPPATTTAAIPPETTPPVLPAAAAPVPEGNP